jgi:hypothetical protein
VIEVTVSAEVEARSQALYTIVQRLHDRGYVLRAIDHRQQNLESVFLKLTTSTM